MAEVFGAFLKAPLITQVLTIIFAVVMLGIVVLPILFVISSIISRSQGRASISNRLPQHGPQSRLSTSPFWFEEASVMH